MNVLFSFIRRPVAATSSLQAGALHLQKGSTLHVPGAAGWRVKALKSAVWITQDGEHNDVVLEPGQSYVFSKDGEGLLTTFDETDICVGQVSGSQASELRAA